MAKAVQLENLTKKFGDFTAVDSLSFSVPQGSIFGFLGPNGSGKSTTLRMMLSLIKPTSGHIELFGSSLELERRSIMSKIGVIIEKPDFYTYLSALDNLKLFARAGGLDFTKKDYDALLTKVGLKGREKDKVKTYSHGMKQRLGLAQALIHDPQFIILDEPNTGLDPLGIIELRELMLDLNKKEGKTILFSSHILSEVEAVCDHLVVIDKGKKVVEGVVKDLLSNEDLLVDVEVGNFQNAMSFLEGTEWAADIVEKQEIESSIKFNLSKNRLASLNAFLVQKGVDVMGMEYRKRLEEYFLKITNN